MTDPLNYTGRCPPTPEFREPRPPGLRVPPGGSDPTGESDVELDPMKLAAAVRAPDAPDTRRPGPPYDLDPLEGRELDPTRLAARIPRH